ncbi:MAG: hypothetical protein APF84_12570 [Gracilibacter sp. BRH_c7a]|nr:MAG: hypothetical protein APF84_12570 [Gracilibacter sp. BRH_c7a]
MKFEEALKHLRENQLVSRAVWGDKWLELKDENFIIYTQNMLGESWEHKDEDIIAEDWKLFDCDDIKKFHLSVNELKGLGVTQEAIDTYRQTLPLCLIKSGESIQPERILKKELSPNFYQDKLLNVKLYEHYPVNLTRR